MSDTRPQAPPYAPADDPSIPVLNERLYLRALEIDMGLPADAAKALAGQPQADAPATDEPPTDEPPTDEPPIDEPPTDVPPIDVSPTDEPLTDTPASDASDAGDAAQVPAESAVTESAVSESGATQEPESASTEMAAASVAQAPTLADPAEVAALREALLLRMQGKVTEQINDTLRDLLQPAIDDTILRLADEAKFALRLTIQELVERALREELKARAESEGGADKPDA